MTRFLEIKAKLARFQARYPDGRYSMFVPPPVKPPLNEAQLQQFEQQHRVRLPDGYRAYLREIGNGGPGPYYGILPLEDALVEYDLNEETDYLSKPFPLRDEVVLLRDCAGVDAWEEYRRRKERDPDWAKRVQDCMYEYSTVKYRRGTLRICHWGCGVYFLLVVTGEEREWLWVEDLDSDNGITPLFPNRETKGRVDFLTWYENWLDKVLSDPEDLSGDSRRYAFFEYAARR